MYDQNLGLLAKLPSKRKCRKCFSEKTREWREKALNRDGVDHVSINHGALNHSTALPRNVK